MKTKICLLALLASLCIFCKDKKPNTTQAEQNTSSIEATTIAESIEEKESLDVKQIEPIFETYWNNEDEITFCSELEDVFKDYIDSLFIADIREDVISNLELNADTLLIVEFEKEKFRIKEIHIFCESLFCMSNRYLRANNVSRYIAEEHLMNKYYNLMLPLLKPKEKALLIKDQELWMKSYESSKEIAAILAEENGGTEIWLFGYYYMTPNFIERTEYLFKWYSFFEERYCYEKI